MVYGLNAIRKCLDGMWVVNVKWTWDKTKMMCI